MVRKAKVSKGKKAANRRRSSVRPSRGGGRK